MAAYSLTMLTPYLGGAGVAWLYYRRMRRHFGYQPWQPRRMGLRIGLLVVASVALLAAAVFLPHVGLGVAIGAVLGVALGLLALRHTRLEWRDGLPGYVPNPWIGGLLSVVLVARLVWRWNQGALAAGPQQASPLTFAIAAALVAQGLTQGIGLMVKLRRPVA